MVAEDPNAPSPDRYVHREVSDLRVAVGRFDQKLSDIEKDMDRNMVTQAQLAKSRLEDARRAMNILIPLLAAALGALAIMFSGVVQVVLP